MKGLTQFFCRTFLVATVTCIVACSDSRPEGVLSRPEMVQAMEELYIAEEKINRLALPRDSARGIFNVMQSKVFQDAAITDSVFRKSFDYYMEHPEEMELIYTALVDTLQLREQRSPFRPDEQ